jgi:hypothetical protein
MYQSITHKNVKFFHGNATVVSYDITVQLKNISWKQKVPYRFYKSPPSVPVFSQSDLIHTSPFHY